MMWDWNSEGHEGEAVKEKAVKQPARPKANAAGVPAGAGRVVARLAKAVERALGPLDLSLPQYRVLAVLGEGTTASSVIARQLAVSPPSITALLDGLVARGLVVREADSLDRRRLTLILTPEGTRVLANADAAAEARLAEIAEQLEDTPTARKAMGGAFADWNRALDTSRDQHANQSK
jgi:long-chain acyl-CoA synthetase